MSILIFWGTKLWNAAAKSDDRGLLDLSQQTRCCHSTTTSSQQQETATHGKKNWGQKEGAYLQKLRTDFKAVFV